MAQPETPPSPTHLTWQPMVNADAPLAFRIGAAGLGAGAGCGVGIGFGRPLALGALPIAGQAAQGITAGLGASMGGAGAALQGSGAAARRQVLRLGVQGLDAGFGCGVGVGYGFFVAGLVVKPSVLDNLRRGVHQIAG